VFARLRGKFGVTEQEIGGGDDAVERRANLVAHVGEELALGARGLGGAARGGGEIAGTVGDEVLEVFVDGARFAERLLAAVVRALDHVHEGDREHEDKRQREEAVAREGLGGKLQRATEALAPEDEGVEAEITPEHDGEEHEGEQARGKDDGEEQEDRIEREQLDARAQGFGVVVRSEGHEMHRHGERKAEPTAGQLQPAAKDQPQRDRCARENDQVDEKPCRDFRELGPEHLADVDRDEDENEQIERRQEARLDPDEVGLVAIDRVDLAKRLGKRPIHGDRENHSHRP
jgi:hypothetical protein